MSIRIAFAVAVFFILVCIGDLASEIILLPYDTTIVAERPHSIKRVINDYFESGTGNIILSLIIGVVAGFGTYLMQRSVFRNNTPPHLKQ